MTGERGHLRLEAVAGTSTDSEMYSKAESRQIMEGYFALVQAVHDKTRSYQALLGDFNNLIELYDKQRKLLKLEGVKRREAEKELAAAEERMRLQQQENEEKESTIRMLNAQLKDARAQVSNQLGQIGALKADLDEWEQRMAIIKTNLKEQLESLDTENRKELAFIRDPSLYRSHSRSYAERRGVVAVEEPEKVEEDEESVDYDKTDDDIDEEEEVPTKDRRSGRRSSLHQPLPSSSHRRSFSAQPPAKRRTNLTTTVEVEEVEVEVFAPPKHKRSRDDVNQPSMKREVTTTTITFDMPAPQRPRANVDIHRRRSRSTGFLEHRRGPVMGTLDIRTPRVGAVESSWTRGRPLFARVHNFEKLPSFFKMMTSCDVCDGVISFKAAVKCNDCTQHAHEACAKKLPLPCVPKSATPRRDRTPAHSTMGPRLQEFCPPTAPMIPAPLIHCVVALEKKNGLDYAGIYRIPADKEQVLKLLNELKTSRAVPKMELQRVETIADCIKKFLRDLRDPLIPKTSRQEFVHAAATGNQAALHSAIRDLPQPNRDTLAFLCLHWLKVAARSSINKMPTENLVRCLAPTVVGLHALGARTATGADETDKAQSVLAFLLYQDTAYWEAMLPPYDGVSATSTLMRGGEQSSSTPLRAPPLIAPRTTRGRPHNLDFSDGPTTSAV